MGMTEIRWTVLWSVIQSQERMLTQEVLPTRGLVTLFIPESRRVPDRANTRHVMIQRPLEVSTAGLLASFDNGSEQEGHEENQRPVDKQC